MVAWHGAIVWEPGQLWCIHEVGDCHSVVLAMVNASHLDIVSEPGEALHDAVSGVAIDHVIVAGHKHNIQRFRVPFLHIVQPESMSKGIYSSTWYGDIVAVHDIPFILLGGIVARRGIELVESAVCDNNLDPGVRIGEVVGLAGGTQVPAVGFFHSCQLSEPEAGEVSVVNKDLGLRVGLGVGADKAVPRPTVVRGMDILCCGVSVALGRMFCMLGRLPGTLGWWVVLALVSVVVDRSCVPARLPVVDWSCVPARLPVVGVAAVGMGATVVPVNYQDLYRQT